MSIAQKPEPTYEDYKNACIKFAEGYRENPSDHILNLMVSVCMSRDKLRHGGSFAEAIVANDLYEAVIRADAECLQNIRLITLAKNRCYLNF